MVKKRSSQTWEECPKCLDATNFLKRLGLYQKIDEVVDVCDSVPDSNGWSYVEKYKIKKFPYYVVLDYENTRESPHNYIQRTYESTVKFVKDEFGIDPRSVKPIKPSKPD